MVYQYRFYFFGLVAHIGNNTDTLDKRYSAVVWDDAHDPYLVFGRDDVVTDILKLNRISSITIAEDLPRLPARVQPTFDKYVPHLEPIMGGNLESDVAIGTGDDATYFHHVGGKLYAAALYKFKAQHFRNGEKEPRRNECVAFLTLLLLDHKEDRIIINAGPLSRVITPADCVLIANIDRKDNHDPRTKPHIRKYSKLTNSSSTSIIIEEKEKCEAADSLEVPAAPCEWVRDYIRTVGLVTVDHSECGNTNWP